MADRPLPAMRVEPVAVGRATGWRAACSEHGVPIDRWTRRPAVSRRKIDALGEAEAHLRAEHDGRGRIQVR